jgi:hypothetical protein
MFIWQHAELLEALNRHVIDSAETEHDLVASPREGYKILDVVVLLHAHVGVALIAVPAPLFPVGFSVTGHQFLDGWNVDLLGRMVANESELFQPVTLVMLTACRCELPFEEPELLLGFACSFDASVRSMRFEFGRRYGLHEFEVGAERRVVFGARHLVILGRPVELGVPAKLGSGCVSAPEEFLHECSDEFPIGVRRLKHRVDRG